jgi:hypothetical protein
VVLGLPDGLGEKGGDLEVVRVMDAEGELLWHTVTEGDTEGDGEELLEREPVGVTEAVREGTALLVSLLVPDEQAVLLGLTE